MSVLKVNEVSKAFENEKIIENISLELHEGEIVSLLGVSGGGKTTLFNIIAGLSVPDKGEVILDGENITGKAVVLFLGEESDSFDIRQAFETELAAEACHSASVFLH